MGGNHKGFLKLEEETFMERLIEEMGKGADRLWISYGEEIHAEYPQGTVIQDEYPGCGPISGIYAGLKRCSAGELMVAACDMPFLKIDFFYYLQEKLQKGSEDCGGAVPVCEGKIHPLAAIYRKWTFSVFEDQIEKKSYRIRDALDKINVLYVDVTGQPKWKEMLKNINTPEDYQQIKDGKFLRTYCPDRKNKV